MVVPHMISPLKDENKIKIKSVLEGADTGHFNSFCERLLKHDTIILPDNVFQPLTLTSRVSVTLWAHYKYLLEKNKEIISSTI